MARAPKTGTAKKRAPSAHALPSWSAIAAAFVALVAILVWACSPPGVREVVEAPFSTDAQSYTTAPPTCADKHTSCASWASQGECSKNSGYMHDSCKASCGLCEGASSGPASSAQVFAMQHRKQCQRPADAVPTLTPGSMDQVFADAVASFAHLEPTVHSKDPWLVTFDRFLTEEEAGRLFQVGSKGMARSTAVAGMDSAGRLKREISNVRTSENSWCPVAACDGDDVIRGVTERISRVTKADPATYELYQVLRYEPGGFYRKHHDIIDEHLEFPFQSRVYTFFLYLSDVEEGGETYFEALNISVAPKLGRAVWWPNVLASDPIQKVRRTASADGGCPTEC